GVEVEPFHCDIYLDQEKAPGGYLWLFPKSEDKVNIGLGIQQKRSSKPLSALLKDWLATDDRFKEMTPLSDDSNLTGSWQVWARCPTSHPSRSWRNCSWDSDRTKPSGD